MSSHAILLKSAFGKNMVNGTHEWDSVNEVVRTSFLLLYRELQHQNKHIQILEQKCSVQQTTEPKERWELLQEQFQLLHFEIQTLSTQVRALQSPHIDPLVALTQQLQKHQEQCHQDKGQWYNTIVSIYILTFCTCSSI